METKTSTQQILTIMHILAWVAFIGFMIQAGAMLVSYSVSCVNPLAARNLYKGLNLYGLRQFNFLQYTLHVFLVVILLILKSYVWFTVIKIISKVNLTNPFKMEVANKLEKISYILFVTWLAALINSMHLNFLLKITGEQYGNEVSGEFIFVAGLVFIISQIFKQGVEIQTENELTI